jgi:hypothetical protein
MTTKGIKEAIERKTGESLNEENLQRLLTYLEQYGFVKKDFVPLNNKPLIVWKA